MDNNNIFGGPDKENNNLFNSDEQNSVSSNTPNTESKPIIEIPQEYYDKLQQEENEKIQEQIKMAEEKAELEKNSAVNSKIWGFVVINSILIALCIYYLLDKTVYTLIGIGAYVAVGSIIFAAKNKKESSFPTSYMVGGIISAALFFGISLLKKGDEADTYIHYAMVAGGVTILGWIIASILNYFVVNKKDIKALQTMGIFIVLALVVGGPVFFYKKFPEQFEKYVLNHQMKVIATTEKEFVEKTLKNRYGLDFTCDKGRTTNNVHSYVTIRHSCSTGNIKFNAVSTAYNESEVLYVVQDEFLEVSYLKDIKAALKEKIDGVSLGNSSIWLYPKDNWCGFVGDCSDNDNYSTDVYKSESKIQNQYEYSSKLNLKKYVNVNNKDFVNDYQFRYIIDVTLSSSSIVSQSYSELVDKVLEVLNDYGIENNVGFEIKLNNSIDNIKKTVFEVVGKATDDKKFYDYEEIEVK